MSKFHERLAGLIIESETSVQELSEKYGFSLSALYKWLRGVCYPSFDNLVLLADNFGCSADYLLGLKDDEVEYTANEQRQPFDVLFSDLLKEKNVSEYRLVKQTGLARSKVDEWRKAASLPSVESLVLVAKFFDVTVDRLVGRE
ncbi:MAG: helix-turn-helix domain-containing protein [Christensenella sp.]|nr:MAG: helix-turn-helix domain-containing protein [Christensenella sp.]